MSRGKNCLWGLLRECTIKYDPMGNRIWRESVVNGVATGRKYIVDISGELPTILCEIEDPNSFVPGSLKKSYYYADGQILSQRVHAPNDPNSYTPYFYVHDRLGSVRMVVDDTGTAVCSYTYRPYGAFYEGECVETTGVDNPWKFTGQWYDAEIEQYYLRARQYDPAMMRFTSRDPEAIYVQEPSTINKYLYGFNCPLLYVDPTGEFGVVDGIIAAYDMHMTAVGVVATGVAMGNWEVMAFGAFLDTTIAPMMLQAIISVRKKVSADDALTMGEKWASKGGGYKEIASGVFRSKDGTRLFRITDSCITGKHGGGPHVVFEYLEEGAKNMKKIHVNIYE